MSLDRNLLPSAESYFEERGVPLKGPGRWKTCRCIFHGGSDSMRVNAASGAWICMNCGARGGDVLAFEMQSTGAEFVAASKALGCWVDDGRAQVPHKPSPLTPRQALSVLAYETTVVTMTAHTAAKSGPLTETDLSRLLVATGRINKIAEIFQ